MKQDNTKILKNLPPKGTIDWFPEEFKVRQYIFDTFKKVCTSFGYEQYLTPTFEKADLYKAKSGEDIGGKQLITFRDKVDREFALRPEMTPSVIRMITRIYNNQPKPIRYFSITNFFRNEKPQRGRNREFWQLNYDIFGSKSIYADVEIVKIALAIMFEFLPEKKLNEKDYKPFTLYVNDRRVLTSYLENGVGVKTENLKDIVRILDKREKLKKEDFESMLLEKKMSKEQIEQINKFLKGEINLESIDGNVTKELKEFLDILKKQGYEKWVKYKPSLVRGFDYYNGIVYEVYDNHPQNNRALFGGGRYDGLGEIFGNYDIPAVGVAPGDETLKLFLENWELLEPVNKDKKVTYYIPLIDLQAREEILKLSQKLKEDGKIVTEGLEKESLSKSLEFANKKEISKVIIIGTNELKDGTYLEKDMETGNQIVINL